jgi:hypothetical protein
MLQIRWFALASRACQFCIWPPCHHAGTSCVPSTTALVALRRDRATHRVHASLRYKTRMTGACAGRRSVEPQYTSGSLEVVSCHATAAAHPPTSSTIQACPSLSTVSPVPSVGSPDPSQRSWVAWIRRIRGDRTVQEETRMIRTDMIMTALRQGKRRVRPDNMLARSLASMGFHKYQSVRKGRCVFRFASCRAQSMPDTD